MEADDIEFSRLNLVQKMSEFDIGEIGDLLIDKENILLAEGEVTNVVVFKIKKGWRENVPFDDDTVPQVAWSKPAARELEAESEFGSLLEFAEVVMLFKQPEGGEDDVYPFTIGENNYALGTINVAKLAYRKTYKKLATFFALNNTVPLTDTMWSFKAIPNTQGKYTWHVPTLSFIKEKPAQEIKDFISSLGL